MMVTRPGRPTILYVEDDDDTRPGMRQLLNRNGYHVIVDSNEEDALERGSHNRIDADLILINLGLHSDKVLAAAHRIRAHTVERADIPVVVIAYKYGPDIEGQDIEKEDNSWVTYLEDGEQLERLLAHLLVKSSDK